MPFGLSWRRALVEKGSVGAGGEDGGKADLSESLTALGQFVLTEQSLTESLQRVAELSVRAVYGADGAGVTWVVEGRPTTVTAAGDFVRRIDEIQYTLGEGPCLEAYGTQQMVLCEDLVQESRWPRTGCVAWSPRRSAFGARTSGP